LTNSITNRQMFFIIFLTLTTYTTIDLPQVAAQAAGRSTWIPLIAAFIPFGLGAIIIAKLNNMYLGKVFFDYSQEIIGKFFAYLIAIYLTLYYMFIGLYLKLKLVSLLTSNFLPKTPHFVMLLFAIALFGYVAYKGITNIARLLEMYGVVFLLVTVGICLLMLSQGTIENILPLYNPNEAEQFIGALKDFITPYGGIEILLIVPFSTVNKKAPKIAFLTLLFVGLLYVLIVESTVMTLGINNTIVYQDPFIEAIKVIEVPVIERVDIFYLTFGLTSLFAGMIIVFAGTAEFACKIFSRVKRWIIVTAFSALSFILSLFALGIPNINDMLEKYSVYLVLVSGFLIPITVFIIAKVKNRVAQL